MKLCRIISKNEAKEFLFNDKFVRAYYDTAQPLAGGVLITYEEEQIYIKSTHEPIDDKYIMKKDIIIKKIEHKTSRVKPNAHN